jgi:hypothetical protein
LRRKALIDEKKRFRLKKTDSLEGRPHLLQHARMGDEGEISGPSKQSPQMSDLYVIVRFPACGHDHRLLQSEIEDA